MPFKKTINAQAHNWLMHEILYKSVEKNLDFVHGITIDIGCGIKPYEKLILQKCSKYIGVENIHTLHGFSKVELISSADKLSLKSDCCDTVLLFQVLEHCSKPRRVLEEIYRILKPGGFAIITTPFLWGVHEEPFDFFRYTEFGIRILCKEAGFNIISITSDSGLFTTLILRFNYFLKNYSNKYLRYIITPVLYLDQLLAKIMDRIFTDNKNDTVNYTTVIRK